MVKFGVDFRRLATAQVLNQLVNGYFFTSPAGVLGFRDRDRQDPASNRTDLFQLFGVRSGRVEGHKQTAFFCWAALGFEPAPRKWHRQPAVYARSGHHPYDGEDRAPTDSLWQTDRHAFAPRVGVAYQIRQNQGLDTVLRGGIGLFYDTGNTQGAVGLIGVGFASSVLLPGVSFPLTAAQNTLPPPSAGSPYNNFVFAFEPHLTLPYTLQWNVAMEQALGGNQSLTVTYVGAAGRDLISSRFFNLAGINPNFSLGNGLYVITNGASSNYNALQAEFQRRLSQDFQVLASYTWSHSIDDLSTNFASYEPPIRGNSELDIRNNFAAGLTYDLPGRYGNPIAGAVLRHWASMARLPPDPRCRSTSPVASHCSQMACSSTFGRTS